MKDLSLQTTLWQKSSSVNADIIAFTAGRDRELDLLLAPFDVLGSLAHIRMLNSIGLLNIKEYSELKSSLVSIYHRIKNEDFVISDSAEDIHSQVELLLTEELGTSGKKIHSGRSRNDQVLLDTKLFSRDAIEHIVTEVSILSRLFISLSEKYKNVIIPGYTHMQVAMPSSFGLWFAAYAESIVEDISLFKSAYYLANKNPLGSGAGYGSSFPLNRELTTELLGFDRLHVNVVNAQMSRGKTEKTIAFAMAGLAATISRFCMDVCLYMSQDLKFLSLPAGFTTGSSIMPHKKNPDVFELIRARCNKIQALPTEVTLTFNNLPSGYHRDLQIVKESFLPSFKELNECIIMLHKMLPNLIINENISSSEKYRSMFSVELVNKRVLEGIPFRDAYKEVGLKMEHDHIEDLERIEHTHTGSINNLSNHLILKELDSLVDSFNFRKVNNALFDLLNS